jgi:hypothetical protein
MEAIESLEVERDSLPLIIEQLRQSTVRYVAIGCMSTSFPYILSKIDRELLSQDTGWASIHNELAHNQGYQQQTASLDVSLKRLHPLITGLALLS